MITPSLLTATFLGLKNQEIEKPFIRILQFSLCAILLPGIIPSMESYMQIRLPCVSNHYNEDKCDLVWPKQSSQKCLSFLLSIFNSVALGVGICWLCDSVTCEMRFSSSLVCCSLFLQSLYLPSGMFPLALLALQL